MHNLGFNVDFGTGEYLQFQDSMPSLVKASDMGEGKQEDEVYGWLTF